MKKVLFFVLSLLLAIPLMAQETTGIATGYEDVFMTFAALVAGIPFIAEAIKALFKVTGGFAAQLIAWATGVALGAFGYVLHLGMFETLLLWQSLVVGFGASLAANGVFDSGLVEWILRLLGIIKTSQS